MTPPMPGPDSGLNGAVAAELRAERAAQNMTVKELAVASDIPFPSLRRYLAGERHIDVAVLDAVCTALEIETGLVIKRAAERLERLDDSANVSRLPDRTAVQHERAEAALYGDEPAGEPEDG